MGIKVADGVKVVNQLILKSGGCPGFSVGSSVITEASLVAQMVVCLQCRRPRVRSLVQEDPLVKGVATHSSILAWKIPWTEEPGRPQSMWSQRGTQVTNIFTFHFLV